MRTTMMVIGQCVKHVPLLWATNLQKGLRNKVGKNGMAKYAVEKTLTILRSDQGLAQGWGSA